MTTRSRKKLVLPPGMASLAAEPEKMLLHTANKCQHPGVIDDWEHPNDTETIGEKLKKKAQKKEDQAKAQQERDKEKNLTANHPGTGKNKSSKNSSSARQLVDSSTTLANEDLTSQGGDDTLAVVQNRGSAPAEEEMPERHPACVLTILKQSYLACKRQLWVMATKVQMRNLMHTCLHMILAIFQAKATKKKQKPKPAKVSARASIAAARLTNNGTGTPALTIQNVPMEPPTIAKTPNLKRKATCTDSAASETANVFESDNDGPENTTAGTQPEPMHTAQPAKKKKLSRSKARSKVMSKATASSEIVMSGPLGKNWEKKKAEEMRLTSKKVLARPDNDSLVQAGGMVEDHEDIKPEFIDIVKVPAQAVDCKVTGSQSTMLKISDPVPANMTATQVRSGKKKWNMNHLPDGTQEAFSKQMVPYLREKVGWSSKPWASLTAEDVQEAIDVEFGSGKYGIAEKGAWMGLANYCITDFHHEICTEAENVVKVFIIEHSDQLLTAEHIAPGKDMQLTPPYMWKDWRQNGLKRAGMFCHEFIIRVMADAHFIPLPETMDNLSMIPFPKGALLLTVQVVGHTISMWSTGKFVNNAPAFSLQNYDDLTEEYALSPAKHAKYGKNVRKKSVKMKWVSVYLATLESWDQDKWNTLLTDVKTATESSTSRKKRKISTSANTITPDLMEEEPDIIFKLDPLEPESGSGSEGSDSDSDGEEEADDDGTGSEGVDVLAAVNSDAGSGIKDDELVDENSAMIVG
ncbi:hypothetical protein EV421DRAFT_2001322 [Armillaria borealis]|uniref:DUF6532 domain-containing protein n=1 Tax=Armillaria borealis TaxID=47425 RepID=A0AA39IXE8_9AGAR|nr:hypothetical protein EV421DRAFT_2001322 [Armillaria borealis]